MANYTVAIDAMSGDVGPAVTVPAALHALKRDPDLNLILVGDESVLEKQLSQQKVGQHPRLEIVHASQIVEMHELPSAALRNKKDSSMRVAINLIKEERAQACVSAGNTGALTAIARFVLKTIPGIDRPAISTVLPTMKDNTTVRMLDLGANVDVQVEHLLQFAIMGSILSSLMDKVPEPRVALLNIGSEEIKGNTQIKAAAELLARTPVINYVGFVEGNTIYEGDVNVVVCDGFVGNVALKVTEGVMRLLSSHVKKIFSVNFFTRLIGSLAFCVLRRKINRIDPTYHNGASLVGLQGAVIKSHGSAGMLAFSNAINVAVFEIRENIPQQIHDRIVTLLKKTS